MAKAFKLLSLLSFIIGLIIILVAKSAIHEILGTMYFMLSAILALGFAISVNQCEKTEPKKKK